MELSRKEIGSFPVFSGLSGVKLNKRTVDNGYFVTYVSTSWKKEISEMFMGGNEGMILEIDKAYKSDVAVYCCDVSWISKFPDECEILFARSTPVEFGYNNNFQCIVMDDSKGTQTISLQKMDNCM